jgi:hypothetical protein
LKRPKPKAALAPRTSPPGLQHLEQGVFGLAILLAVAVRLRLLGMPLERDEGEYAYLGRLMLEGVPPYSMAGNMKLPGVYGAYALIMAVFGQTIEGVRLGLLVANVATMVLVYLLARRLFDPATGLVAGATYALLSVSPSVLGLAAHATHFVVLPALGGLLLLLKAADTGRPTTLLCSGLCLGLAFIMKQPGIFFAILGSGYLLWNDRFARQLPWGSVLTRTMIFSVGVLVPFLLMCLALWVAGVFDRLWFWTVQYALQYGSRVSLSRGIETFVTQLPRVVGPSVGLWGLAGLGLIALWRDVEARSRRRFVLAFLIFSFLAVCPGLYFREHYFILILPAIAISAGLGVSSVRRQLVSGSRSSAWSLVPVGMLAVACGFAVVQQRAVFFQAGPRDVSRMMYGTNPFPEAVEVAEYIKAHSAKDDRIAVLGSEPEIYFYADRYSATRHIYTYGLLEEQPYALRMQREMIDDIETARPRFLVFVRIPTSWLVRPQSERLIFDWFERHRREHYELVGLVDIRDFHRTEYQWGDEVKHQPLPLAKSLYVFRRKEAS